MRRTDDYLPIDNDENIQSFDDVELETIENINRGRIKDIVFSMPQIYREVITLQMVTGTICMSYLACRDPSFHLG